MSTSKTNAPARAAKVSFTGDDLNVVLTDGQKLIVPTVLYPRLKFGTQAERRNFRLISAGAGIHWPDLDEDISIAGLLAGDGSAEAPKSILKWLMSRQKPASSSVTRQPTIRMVKVARGRSLKKRALGTAKV